MDEREHVIVCGVDCSPASARALEYALAEAARRHCTVRAVTAWSGRGMEAVTAVSSPEKARREAAAAQRHAVHAATADLTDPPRVEHVLVEDSPARALVRASLDAELLVLGSHGHGALHDAVVPSTSHRVLHHASCPVVVVPDPRCADQTRQRLGQGAAAVPA